MPINDRSGTLVGLLGRALPHTCCCLNARAVASLSGPTAFKKASWARDASPAAW